MMQMGQAHEVTTSYPAMTSKSVHYEVGSVLCWLVHANSPYTLVDANALHVDAALAMTTQVYKFSKPMSL